MKKISAIAFALFLLSACNSANETKSDATDSPAAASDVPTAADASNSIVLPPSSTDPVKKSIEGYASGDLAAFTENMDDNIKFYYPGPGDSLVGKAAVVDFYTKRRAVADSIQVVNPIFLGIRNTTNPAVAQGDWLMSWYTFAIKYKNGKRVGLPIHTVQHVNSAGKVDIMAMYYDMHRVMEASK
jgi:hypothetical protein